MNLLADFARRRPLWILAATCLAFFLPGLFSLPVLDRDEARFAQASKQMLESGDLIVIRFQEAERNKKPAGIHWLQTGAVALLSGGDRQAIWAYRVPSVAGAAIAVFAVFGLGRTLFSSTAGLFAACVLAGCLLLVAEATIAKADAVLLACVVLAHGALARFYLASRSGGGLTPRTGLFTALVLWTALGAGILIKGPIAPMIAALTVLALAVADRRARWLGTLHIGWGFVILSVLVLPWLFAVQSATQGRFLAEALGHDLLAKVQSGQESHGAPPLTFLALLPLTFWPGSLLLLPALIMAWHRRADPSIRFCLAWILPAWLIFELTPTKLPHYVLPLYPALALLVGAFLTGVPAAGRSQAIVLRWSAVVWLVPAVVLAAGPIYLLAKFGPGATPLAIGAALAAAALSGLAASLAWKGTCARAVIAGLAAMAVAGFLSLELSAPNLESFWLSDRLARVLNDVNVDARRPIALSGYREPSSVFLLGTDTRLSLPLDAADALADGAVLLAVVENRDAAPFFAQLARRGKQAVAIENIIGINYSKGQEYSLTIFQISK